MTCSPVTGRRVATGQAPARPGSRPSSAATRPKWASAEPEANRSQHPRRPHGQSGPSGSTTMWPISPTKPLLPRWMTPPASTPPPMPVPRVTSTASRAPWALPTVDSASSAQVASLSMDDVVTRARSGQQVAEREISHLGDVRGGAEHALRGSPGRARRRRGVGRAEQRRRARTAGRPARRSPWASAAAPRRASCRRRRAARPGTSCRPRRCRSARLTTPRCARPRRSAVGSGAPVRAGRPGAARRQRG